MSWKQRLPYQVGRGHHGQQNCTVFMITFISCGVEKKLSANSALRGSPQHNIHIVVEWKKEQTLQVSASLCWVKYRSIYQPPATASQRLSCSWLQLSLCYDMTWTTSQHHKPCYKHCYKQRCKQCCALTGCRDLYTGICHASLAADRL